MLRLTSLAHHKFPSLSFPLFDFQTVKLRSPRKFVTFAGNGGNGSNNSGNLRQDSTGNETNGTGGDSKKDQRPLFSFKLGDLLGPEPDNIAAVGLTCVLTWASVQVLWQLFVISSAIVVAALKYSFIAALLIFILITLL